MHEQAGRPGKKSAKQRAEASAERGRQVVAMRQQGMTLQQVADKMGISRERVRQIEAKAARLASARISVRPEAALADLTAASRAVLVAHCSRWRPGEPITPRLVAEEMKSRRAVDGLGPVRRQEVLEWLSWLGWRETLKPGLTLRMGNCEYRIRAADRSGVEVGLYEDGRLGVVRALRFRGVDWEALVNDALANHGGAIFSSLRSDPCTTAATGEAAR